MPSTTPQKPASSSPSSRHPMRQRQATDQVHESSTASPGAPGGSGGKSKAPPTASSIPGMKAPRKANNSAEAVSQTGIDATLCDLERNITDSDSLPDSLASPHCYTLRVLDVPFDGSQARMVLEMHNAEMPLKPIEDHQKNTTRVFECTVNKHTPLVLQAYDFQQGVIEHIRKTYGGFSNNLARIVRGIGHDDGEWEGFTESPGQDSWDRLEAPATDNSAICAQFSQTFKMRELAQIWTRTILWPSSKRGRLETRNSHFCCVEADESRLVVINVNLSEAAFIVPHPGVSVIFANRGLVTAIDDGHRIQWLGSGKNDIKRQRLFLTLEFLLNCVYLQDASHFDFFMLGADTYRRDPLLHMILSLTHKYDLIPKGSDSDVIDQMQKCEQILQDIQDTTDAIQFVLKVMNIELSPSPQSPEDSFESANKLQYLKIRERCSQRTLNCQRRIDRINRTIETKNRLFNIHEATSVKQLTILAALFLPASLASSFLSMSQRFRDLGPLLYDWFGTFIFVGSASVAIFLLLRAALYVKGKLPKSWWSPREVWTLTRLVETGRHKFGPRVLVLIQVVVLLGLWGSVLACVTLGMFYNLGLGGRVLGYGVAGSAAFFVLTLVVMKAFFTVLDRIWETV